MSRTPFGQLSKAALFAPLFVLLCATPSAWAQGAENYIADCIALFEEYGWDWTYHAFREWNGWSVEHEGPDAKHMVPSADNPRKRVLLDGLRGVVRPPAEPAGGKEALP